MSRKVVALAAFFVKAKPSTIFLLKEILDVHRDNGTDSGKAEQHDADDCAITESFDRRYIDAVKKLAGFLGGKARRLATPHHVLRPPDTTCGVHWQDLASDKIVEEHSDGGQMLLHGRSRVVETKLLDVRSNKEWIDIDQGEMLRLAPTRKAKDGAGVCFPRISISSVGRQELDKTPRCFFAGVNKEQRHSGHRDFLQLPMNGGTRGGYGMRSKVTPFSHKGRYGRIHDST
jgi:hypothetical protein